MDTDKYLIEILNRLATDITELKVSIKDVIKTQSDQDKKIMILEMCKDKISGFTKQFNDIKDRVDDLENSGEGRKVRQLIRRNALTLKILGVAIVFEILIAYHTKTLGVVFESIKHIIKAIF